VLEEQSEEYQRGYMNVLSAQQQRYSLRNRDVPAKPIQKKEGETTKNDSSATQRKGKEVVVSESSKSKSAEQSQQLATSK